MEYQQDSAPKTAIPTAHPSRIFPVPRLATIFAIFIIGFLIYAFFSGLTKQFYASIVFSFYYLTKSMWVSVVMLGVFQTLLLIPLRIISLLKSANLKEFEDTFKKIQADKVQTGFLKKSFKGGRNVALYYIVNFFIQIVSYTSIGRLFLTDFYNQPLDPHLLYDFVPYPDYPILDRMFKIPYLWFSNTTDLGMRWVWIAWAVIVALEVMLIIYQAISRRVKQSKQWQPLAKFGASISGSTLLFLLLSWILIRHFPIEWSLRIFSGDVAQPNPRFNTLTAIVTAVTLIWVNLPRINKKVELARKAGMDDNVIHQTEKKMFGETIQSALFLGLGAYFITNLIPCAFELSVFTLEIISLFSPLTLDRVILATVKPDKTTIPEATSKPEQPKEPVAPKPNEEKISTEVKKEEIVGEIKF